MTSGPPTASATPVQTIESPADVNETMRLILDACASCLARFGNEKTSIQDVADTAGVSRATIYRYFADRAQLLQAVTDYEHVKQLEEVRARIGDDAGIEHALAIIAEVSAASALRFHSWEHLRNRDRGLAQYLSFQRADRLRSMTELVQPYVQRAYEAGELASEDSLDEAMEWIVHILASIPTLSGSPAFDLDDPAAVGAAFARRICRGLLAPAKRR